MPRYWNGHCWREHSEPVKIVSSGYGHDPIVATKKELECAKAEPLDLTDMLARQGSQQARALFADDGPSFGGPAVVAIELRCPLGHGLDCNCDAARGQRFKVNEHVSPVVVRESAVGVEYNFDGDDLDFDCLTCGEGRAHYLHRHGEP